jgi:hypothetical protein
LIPLLGISILLLVIVWVGQWTRDRLAKLDRYTVALADIDFPPPPNQGRAEFLAEVQYAAGLPDHLHLLDQDLNSRLADAFARHPEVEKVGEIRITPPRQVHIQLAFRTPVMIVTLTGSKSGEFFVVDREGVLLRRSTAPLDLPIYAIPRLSAGPAGSPCSDPNVIAAARTAAFLQTYHAQLPITKIEGSADNLLLIIPSSQHDHLERSILWGHAPGEEKPQEPKAEEKVHRMLESVKSNGNTKNSEKSLDPRSKE